ncbi:MAG: FAD-binding oxidoreductase [Planctomycetota bacterium]|nr:MAG: FAD-binding oxidoreductase [Planctomycetota bacterium]
MNLTPAQSSRLANSLQKRLSCEVFLDEYNRALYSTDASIYQIMPLGVVLPRTRDDVVCAMQVAAEEGLAIVPRGGGTSLSGQSIGAGLVIDFSKYMNAIEIDPASLTARVQPGVVLDQLNAACARHALQFGPDVATSSRANLGGMIGNNSAGARSIWQGKTVDSVLGLDVVMADGSTASLGPLAAQELKFESARNDAVGHAYREVRRIVEENRAEIVARFPSVLRRVSGYNLDEFVPECVSRVAAPRLIAAAREREACMYPGAEFNLAKLLVGAEGTLGTITEALIHLLPLPKVRGVIVLHFDSMQAAVRSIGTVLSCEPSAAELLDGLILRLAEKSLEYRNYLDFVEGHPESLVLVEFNGETAADVKAKADELIEKLSGQPGLFHVLPALEKELCDHVWACRKAALPLLLGLPGTRKPVAFVEDGAVAPVHLPEFVDRFCEIMARHETDGAFYGHASVGCLHIRPMLDLRTAVDIDRLQKISHEVAELVLEFDGAMSGEHGDGLARSYLNERLFGSQLYRAFKEVKAAFDPENRMNPGKVVDGPSPVESLRYGAEYRTLEVPTTFDFSHDGGFARAVELCNGAGVCRKLKGGTMCPSFMATRDEEHSTRGRANALRMVLSGALPPAELTGKRLFDTYELCLGCKACKAECPSNVDVAKLKMEFLNGYYREHGAPLGVRMMAHAARLNKLGSALAPVSNWAPSLPGAGWLMRRLMGIDPRRPLPRFERQHFRKWFEKRRRRRGKSQGEAPRGPIVLLDDCLTSYCEPGVNRAAVAVLEAAGYEVRLADIGCCGRTQASKGFLQETQQMARDNVRRLAPWAARGVPIVGCEPSCLLMLVDEYPELSPGADADNVAAHAELIDSHLVRLGIELPLAERKQHVVLHGHCHQKALVGAADTHAALAAIPGSQVELLDSGCCGMAGSFGYEHYDVSQQIGELVLFPAVRAAPESAIAAPGFSCRHQIEHGTGRQARHPVELLAEQLRPPG